MEDWGLNQRNQNSTRRKSRRVRFKNTQVIEPAINSTGIEVVVLTSGPPLAIQEDNIESCSDAASFAQALSYCGHSVRLITSRNNNIQCWNTYNSDRITIESINTRIPILRTHSSFINYWLDGPCFMLTSAMLALWMTIYFTASNTIHSTMTSAPNSNTPPQLVLMCDTHPIAVPILKCFGNFRIIYFQKFNRIKRFKSNNHRTFLHWEEKLCMPKWMHRIIMRLADDIIVENHTSAEFFRQLFLHCKIPKILYPCVDTGSMVMEEYRLIQKVVPTITRHSHIFLTYGAFKPDSNFELAIDAFDIVYRKILRRNDGEKLKLIIAGNYDSYRRDQREYYKYLVKYACTKKSARDILLMTALTTISKKTLLTYSLALLYTYKNDLTARQIMEAMYIGRPVIATLNDVSEELLPRNAGYLVRPTPTCFARAILQLLDDYKLAEQFGTNAKIHYSKNFSFIRFLQTLQIFVNGDIVQKCKCDNELECQPILECYNQMEE